MGDAKVSLDNRVSPLKNRHESQLLGGLHPVKTQWSPSKLTKNGSTGVAPFDLGMGKGTAGMLTAEEATMAATSDIVKVSLRIQFMHNAQDHLLSYREKLQKANDIMKSIDLNKQV
uniref:Uncharacterized protein n=1 Tax=Favella ehrenbergii TaxID=182087 RepID=A0A7S3MJG9_9SPIT|mmetsp:Transcript_10659/g.13210  ORF Transcript_10659/g.13210 Transcript_10659/m.13210 type:complete len:116 (+) Transcript_10659:2073-2420(+)|eukprot:CAMPEP_0170451678 /NCGR_PEP_ID=MMETSP0123-20130129/835_1 /TAXON_ID=182087 /ORGANISM="Favella ehrenbergii, Strain Fehren 1" /LENGTH=115 /DNA_ID=CAMNT_0010713441 /DNA_START=2054 /DNA_END=2401 /DNA_ORIENTATION=+